MPRKTKSKRLGDPEYEYTPEELAETKSTTEKARVIEETLVKMNLEQSKKMGKWLAVRVAAAKSSKEYQETQERIKQLRIDYEKGVARTNTEMKGSHDYRSYLAAAQADGMRARLITLFTNTPVSKIEGRNQLGIANQINVETLLEYHHENNIQLPEKGDTICTYLAIEGHAVLYSPWCLEIDEESIKLKVEQLYTNQRNQERWVDVNSPEEIKNALEEGYGAKTPVAYRVDEVKGPEMVKNFPDLQVLSLKDYLSPSDSMPTRDPAWEAVRQHFTYAQLLDMEDEGKIYNGILNLLKPYLKRSKVEDAEVLTETGISKSTKISKETFNPEDLDGILSCWVIWGYQVVPGYKGLQKAITLYHHETETVLQTRINPYVGKPSACTHLRFISVPFRFAGIGPMELSTMGERTYNDLENFVLDEGRILSCLPYKFKKQKFSGGMSPFEFWKGIGVDQMGDFEALNFRDRRPVDLAVSNVVRGNTERRTGIGDLQLGRESDVTGKTPPTARGIISIIREGQVRFNLFNISIIAALLKFVKYELKLFQQLMGERTMIEILGPDKKPLFPEGLTRYQIQGSFNFIPNTTAQNLVRELDAEINLLLYDKMSANPFIKDSLEASYNMTKDLLLSFGKKNLWLKPLAFYQKASGQGQGLQEDLNQQEQELADTLIQAGLPIQEVKKQLDAYRSSGNTSPGQAERTVLGVAP